MAEFQCHWRLQDLHTKSAPRIVHLLHSLRVGHHHRQFGGAGLRGHRRLHAVALPQAERGAITEQEQRKAGRLLNRRLAEDAAVEGGAVATSRTYCSRVLGVNMGKLRCWERSWWYGPADRFCQ
jgi:hypothetical protein